MSTLAGLGCGVGFGGLRGARMWFADFTSLSGGAASTLFGLSHTRGSGATVQTGTSALYSTLGTDVAGVGRALDADLAGVVIDEFRQNIVRRARDITAAEWASSGTITTLASGITGPDGTANACHIALPAGGTNQRFSGCTAVNGVRYYASQWVQQHASSGTACGADMSISGVADLIFGSTPAPAAWARVTKTGVCGVANLITLGVQIVFSGSTPAKDVDVDFNQIEAGSFATEAIVTTGSTATRAGARLWHPSAPALVDGGRLSLRMVLQAKGANSDYATDPYLWRIDANNHARIAAATGIVTTTVGGSAHSTATGVTWAQGDVLDIRIETGGSRNGVCRIGKNGGALASIDSAPAAQGALSGSVVDLLQDGSAANVLSARLRNVEAYRAGRMP